MLGFPDYAISTPHPYPNDYVLQDHVLIPCAIHISVSFSSSSYSESGFDILKLCEDANCSMVYGTNPAGYSGNNFPDTYISGPSFYIDFLSDGGSPEYGFDLIANASFGNFLLYLWS